MEKTVTVLTVCTFLLLFITCPVSAQPDVKALVDKECTKCHNLGRVNKASKDIAAWGKTVDRMVKKGANINAEEKDAVIKYLGTLNK
ncbi:MAG: hypothetical protein AB2L12_03435 [Smithellaceae bacterium]